MNIYSYLPVLIGVIISAILIIPFIIFKNKLNFKIFNKIFSIVFTLLFFTWLFSFHKSDLLSVMVGLDKSILISYGSGVAIIVPIIVWFFSVSTVLLAIEPWFNLKNLRSLIKWANLITFILAIGFYPYMHLLLFGSVPPNLEFSNSFTNIMLGIILSLGFFYSLTKWVEDPSFMKAKKEFITFFLTLAGMFIVALPTWIIQYFFGLGDSQLHVLDFALDHRIFIYITLFLPVIIYFILRKQPKDVIKASMVFIAIATMNTFSFRWSYIEFLEPWTWPLHLCNTAMYLITICVVFNTKRLFYFTYFINVFGAFIAVIMPSYSGLTVFSEQIIYFWINHMCAFGMPLLLVALNVFPRPKMKQMWYSIIGFTGYFVIALIANSVFTGLGHPVDFFFLNSDFIPDKFGKWAEDLFNISASVTIGGVTLTFYYLYQLLFYFVYVGIAFSMWYIYTLFFDIFASINTTTNKLHKIKLDQLALESQLNGRSIEEPMKLNTGIKLELEHFSKIYGNGKKFAVHDANLEVYGGEIFGFLGPNGAGKSTTIKSIVGIQMITSGHIYLCGYDVGNQPVEAKRIIGYVPDHYALYENLTGREYINYIADIYDVSLEDRNTRIEKYTTLLNLKESFDSTMRTYSHGMKQKIAIIGALVHNPKLWILDEPLTGLDPDSIYQVKECMKQHASEGNIVMFSSHIIDVVENLCSRVVVIKKGHMLEPISVEEIHKTESLENYYLTATSKEIEEAILSENEEAQMKEKIKNEKKAKRKA
ncbi:MAG: YwaF family protein [Bacilli bacterium]